eukprot:sb/3465767/
MVKEDIEKFKMESVDLENERKNILADLEGRLTSTDGLKDAYDLKREGTSKTLDQLQSGIDSLFNKINCDKSPIVEMLGDSGVTDNNMMQYLGIVEQRTNELLQLHAFVQAKEADSADTGAVPQPPSLLGQGPQPPVTTINIAPPSTGVTGSQHATKAPTDDYESEGESADEDEIRPLTQAELKKKIIKGVHIEKGDRREERKEGEGLETPNRNKMERWTCLRKICTLNFPFLYSAMSNVLKTQTQSKMGRSTFSKSRAGGFGKSTIGGKSVMSSRTNVSSRKSAGLEKPVIKGPAETVFDEDGNDVTPAPLIHPDGAGGVPKGPSKGSIAGDESQGGTSMFQQSVFIGVVTFRARMTWERILLDMEVSWSLIG